LRPRSRPSQRLTRSPPFTEASLGRGDLEVEGVREIRASQREGEREPIGER
jgi:hypothetical protein